MLQGRSYFCMLKPNNIEDDESTCLRKSAVIYGANASGKSQLLRSIVAMKTAVVNSFRDDDVIPFLWSQRFAFSEEAKDVPLKMQMIIEDGNVYYRYGFEIKDSVIEREWLYIQQEYCNKEDLAFERNGKRIEVYPEIFQNAEAVKGNTRRNALFLSTASMMNVRQATVVRNWFRTNIIFLDNNELDGILNYTSKLFAHEKELAIALKNFMCGIDLGIVDIDIKEQDFDLSREEETIEMRMIKQQMKLYNIPNDIKVQALRASTSHKYYSNHAEKGIVSFPFKKESLGTQKVFALLGPWIRVLKTNGVLLVDEFGASLHTMLSSELLNVFNFCNRGGAQLIMSTHDVTLLAPKHFSRDQIWFVEKNKYGESSLYSLCEFKYEEQNGFGMEGDYLKGRFGAIPFVGRAKRFVEDYAEEK